MAAAVLVVPPAAAQTTAAAPPASTPDETPPRLVIKGFGNVDFRNEFDTQRDQMFSLGELDLFVTSELSEKLSFLTEIVFEPAEDHEPLVDVERYQIEYSHSDLVNVALGRMHTMLGHWNQAYHHGAWFQTTAHRPEVYEFEDEGGVLPVHELGLRVSGRRAAGRGRVEYSASLTNGRGPVAHRFENLRDFDRHKAVNLWLAWALPAPAGLKAGGAVRFDRVPAAETRAPLSERVVGGFLTYQHSGTELLAEVLLLTHREKGGLESRFRTSGFYLQASRRLGRFTPFYRFEGLDRAPGHPYYASSSDLRRHVGGVRADPWPWAAVKFEVGHDAPDPGPGYASVALQAAFTF
jgi:hypothetical protein